jgi:hypothetical protein
VGVSVKKPFADCLRRSPHSRFQQSWPCDWLLARTQLLQRETNAFPRPWLIQQATLDLHVNLPQVLDLVFLHLHFSHMVTRVLIHYA